MQYKDKKYVEFPEQQDITQMDEGHNFTSWQNEYEQMHFEVNSIYEEVNNQTYPGQNEGNSEFNLQNQGYNNQDVNQMAVPDNQQIEATQEYYTQIQEMYQQANLQSYQNGYSQGYQECYGQVYEQAYNQAYQIAYQQAYKQAQPMIEVASEPMLCKMDMAIGQIESMVGQVNNMVTDMEQKMENATKVAVVAPSVAPSVAPAIPTYPVADRVEPLVAPEISYGQEETQAVQAEFELDTTEIKENKVINEDDTFNHVEVEPEELHAVRTKQKLENIAREEYVNDIKHFVGKGGKSYIRKFAKMNETKQFLNWNLPAFILGPIWYAYRKMPIISILLTLIMVLTLSTENGLVAIAVVMVLVGALSDKVYKTHVDRLLDARFMMEEKAQASHLKLRGGVSVIYAMTLVVAIIGLGVYTTEVLIYKSDFVRGIYDNLINLYYQYK